MLFASGVPVYYRQLQTLCLAAPCYSAPTAEYLGRLAAVYFALIAGLGAGLGALTGQGQNQLVTVLSTLAIAALFLPLRRRLQAFVDRRFYRRHYAAARILAQFAAAARSETDLEQLAGRLEQVVPATLQPAHTRLWLPIRAESTNPPK